MPSEVRPLSYGRSSHKPLVRVKWHNFPSRDAAPWRSGVVCDTDPMECLFCRIVAGELGSTRVYEDDRVIAIMDIFPATRGHALVIPRAHAADVHDVAEGDL